MIRAKVSLKTINGSRCSICGLFINDAMMDRCWEYISVSRSSNRKYWTDIEDGWDWCDHVLEIDSKDIKLTKKFYKII